MAGHIARPFLFHASAAVTVIPDARSGPPARSRFSEGRRAGILKSLRVGLGVGEAASRTWQIYGIAVHKMMQTVLFTSVFEHDVKQAGLDEATIAEIVTFLAGNPLSDDIIQGTGGAQGALRQTR